MKKIGKFEVLLILFFTLISGPLVFLGNYGTYYPEASGYIRNFRIYGENQWGANSIFHGYSALYTFDLPVKNWMQVNSFYVRPYSDLEIVNWKLQSQIDFYVFLTNNIKFETVIESAKRRLEKMSGDTGIKKIEEHLNTNSIPPTAFFKYDNYHIGRVKHIAVVKVVATKDYIFEFSAITASKDTVEIEKIMDSMRPMLNN